jgi:hypothetical protein
VTRAKSKLPWLDNWRNEFKLNSCRTVEKYVKYHTGLSEVNIHKTERYLVINYTVDGQMKTKKINLPAGVLYCLHEEDFKDFFSEFNKAEPNKNEHKQVVDLKKQVDTLEETLAECRRSHGKLCRAIKKKLGFKNWPLIKGNFVDGIIKILEGNIQPD